VSPTQIGEAFVGSGPNAAHVNTVLGSRGGPVEVAWTTALATPRPGFVPFIAVLHPGLVVKPPTLFVNKADIVAGTEHARLSWGAAQAGVAAGVADALAAGIIPQDEVDHLLLIAAVWVDPQADDEVSVLAYNREATGQALANGAAGRPTLDDVLAGRHQLANPFLGIED
jgi:5,6,7,8-tetrahydromethanopterin hydro-lyase